MQHRTGSADETEMPETLKILLVVMGLTILGLSAGVASLFSDVEELRKENYNTSKALIIHVCEDTVRQPYPNPELFEECSKVLGL